MTDQEFKELQEDIQKKLQELSKLQLIHRKQTGRDFILGQPIMDNSKERLWGEPKPEWTEAQYLQLNHLDRK